MKQSQLVHGWFTVGVCRSKRLRGVYLPILMSHNVNYVNFGIYEMS